MLKKLCFFIIAGFLLSAFQTDNVQDKYARTITKEDLSIHLNIIASAEYEGRETGTPGQKKAANYLAGQFKKAGLKGGFSGEYFQSFEVNTQEPKNVFLKLDGVQYEFLKDFYFFPGFEDVNFNKKEIVFAGYGIEEKEYNDIGTFDYKDKIVVVLSGEPNKKGKYLISGSSDPSIWTTNWKKKQDLFKKKGAAALIVCSNGFEKTLGLVKHQVSKPFYKLNSKEKDEVRSKLPLFYCSPQFFSQLTGKRIDFYYKKIGKGKFKSPFSISKEILISMDRPIKKVSSDNVLGFIEGSDKKDEIIIITAHYDHLGKENNEIYFGADDDGSGTVSLLEIAEAFGKAKSEGKGPRRSILFMPVSGEEKGLLGSQYYVENPAFPLKSTVANLNIDMIGRLDKKHEGDPNYIYIIGSDILSKDLHIINEEANKAFTGLDLDYTYNNLTDPNQFYYRSDHYNFANNNIPVIFYFNGVHEDYHKPTDTVDKINFSKMEKISRLVFYTAWELANRPDRIKLEKKE